MRVGVFGGTFDPVHYGHLILADQAREQAGLDEVWFVPAASHPLKTDHAVTPFAARVEMLRLALAGQEPPFRVDELEAARPGPSFTADTLDELAARHPDKDLSFLVGSDVLPELPRWRDPQRIVARVELVVMERPNWPLLRPADVAAALRVPESAVRLRLIDVPQIDLASRDIRRRMRHGRSVRFMLPGAVEEYARRAGLYRE